MNVIIYSFPREGCGDYSEYVCTSDGTCLPNFDDRLKTKRYAVVYLGNVGRGYCIHCIEKFFQDLQYLESVWVNEAEIQVGKFRSSRTVAAARAFLLSVLRKYQIKHKHGMA